MEVFLEPAVIHFQTQFGIAPEVFDTVDVATAVEKVSP